jgi:rhamnose utilization protein RhaD (predicted bifunctional aldolase and dehydrogenase)
VVDFKKSLQRISFFSGNRFDLVQAGGGNSSVKTDEHTMLVKSSGINLTEVTQDKGYVAVNYLEIRDFIATGDFSQMDQKQRETTANECMLGCQLEANGKPSIETFLHALLDTYTLHTHPISINVLAAQKNWRQALGTIWPDAIFVAYHTPGIDLALAMSDELNAYVTTHGHFPKVVFLQNHGLIVSSPDPQEVIDLSHTISKTIESHLGLDLSRYHGISTLQDLLANFDENLTCIICCDDGVIASQLPCESQDEAIWPFCPDTLIYCGVRPVFLNGLDDQVSIKKYVDVYHSLPKVLIINQQVYFCASSIKKAKEAQELFKFHLLVMSKAPQNIQRLDLGEIAYLSNWDAEKFRQGV